MTPFLFTKIFIAALLLTTVTKLWLAQRHLSHIKAHRAEVPAPFDRSVNLAAHQKAADYTSSRTRLSMLEAVFEAVVLWGFTLGGGIQKIASIWPQFFVSPIYQGMAIIVTVLLISGLLEMPFSLYRTFVIEARYGFNKMTPALYLLDVVKGLLLAAILGLPLLYGVLWLMERMGDDWWQYVWVVWVLFNLLLLIIYPSFIAPLFNKFQPMQDESLRARIESLLKKCGFTASGLFVMDGSKRSSHGNAYFTGFGKTKRIVFFDTLLSRLSPSQIEAVLAHELGHFKRHHVIKRIAISFVLSLAFLWLLAQLMLADWFFRGLGVIIPHWTGTFSATTALALLLFFMVLPVFGFLLHPLTSAYSRKHEFEADAYAAQNTNARDLATALVRMYQDNAATLTPDPLYSVFYDSHPPAPVRIARLQTT